MIRQEVLQFATAIYSKWVAILSGSASVLLATAAGILETNLPSWPFWLAAFVCAWLAAFFVWREANRGKLNAEDQLDRIRNRQKARLAILKTISNGEGFAQQMGRADPALKDFAEAQAWIRDARLVVQAHFPEHLAHFDGEAKPTDPLPATVQEKLGRLRELLSLV